MYHASIHVKMLLIVGLLLAIWVNSGQCTCPTWTHPNKSSSQHECLCGNSLKDAVYCDPNTLEVHLAPYYCISYSEKLNTTVVGTCPYRGHDFGQPLPSKLTVTYMW